jgi:hypothetical protein
MYCKPRAPYSLAQTGFSSCNNCRADAVKGEKCAAKCPVQILHSGVSLYLTSSSQSPSGLQQRTSYSLYLSSSPQSLSGLQQCTSYSCTSLHRHGLSVVRNSAPPTGQYFSISLCHVCSYDTAALLYIQL